MAVGQFEPVAYPLRCLNIDRFTTSQSRYRWRSFTVGSSLFWLGYLHLMGWSWPALVRSSMPLWSIYLMPTNSVKPKVMLANLFKLPSNKLTLNKLTENVKITFFPTMAFVSTLRNIWERTEFLNWYENKSILFIVQVFGDILSPFHLVPLSTWQLRTLGSIPV